MGGVKKKKNRSEIDLFQQKDIMMLKHEYGKKNKWSKEKAEFVWLRH